MKTELIQFLSKNSSALFAILGAVAGGFFSFLSTIIHKRYDQKLRLGEKLLERRINAHEAILKIVQSLRTVTRLDEMGEDGELARYPSVMSSEEHWDDFAVKNHLAIAEASIWLSNKIVKELNFLQDYLITVGLKVQGKSEKQFQDIGCIIRQDFIDFSSNLEKLVKEFFLKQIGAIDPKDFSGWHKYPKEVTRKRFEETMWYKGYANIEPVLNRVQ